MQHGDGALGVAAAHDDGFAEGTGARLTQPDQDPFEPGSRLEQSLLECHVEVKVESFVFSNVTSHSGKQNEVVETLSHAVLQVRGKTPGGSCSPGLRLSDIEDQLPVGQLRGDLKSLGQFPTAVLT